VSVVAAQRSRCQGNWHFKRASGSPIFRGLSAILGVLVRPTGYSIYWDKKPPTAASLTSYMLHIIYIIIIIVIILNHHHHHHRRRHHHQRTKTLTSQAKTFPFAIPGSLCLNRDNGVGGLVSSY